jgi:hypothetical protein
MSDSPAAKVVGPPIPELERLAAVKDESQSIGQFLDWLGERKPRVVLMVPHAHERDEDGELVYRDSDDKIVEGWEERKYRSAKEMEQRERGIEVRYVAQADGDEMFPLYTRMEALLAEYFDIDLNKVENERREMIAGLRTAHDLDDHRKSLGLKQ